MWDLDSTAQLRAFRVFIKFNFLSTNFNPFRDTKEEIFSLFTRSEIFDRTGDSLLDMKAQVHCCRIQLFRGNGAQRKSRNDRPRVLRRIKKLEVNISSVTAQQRTALHLDPYDSHELRCKYAKGSPGSSDRFSSRRAQIANMASEEDHLKSRAHSSQDHSDLQPILKNVPISWFIDESEFKKYSPEALY